MQGENITKELIEDHGLTEEEYQRILDILGREPTLTELGIFSVMWSEHCSYKSSRTLLTTLPTEAPWVIQGPGENAGVIALDETWALVFKMESHNHPSYIEPKQGAATGVGGILRDIFTMGARPIASMDSLRFGELNSPHNRYLLEGVVEGIAWYGNCIGVPTVAGEISFDPSYDGNPLVNAFNLGIVRRDRIFKAQATGIGNPVIYVGSKTGRDGIHGATMASEEFHEDSQEKRPTVQVGDPFTEKLLLEACLEVFQHDWVLGIQDMGAAGLTCSSSEMAAHGGTGVEIDLNLVPQREEGMTPYEIMLSESQERMLLVARKGTEEKVISVFKKWGLDAVVIGQVSGDGMLRVKVGRETVAEIPAQALTDETPCYQRPQQNPGKRARTKENPEAFWTSEKGDPEDPAYALRALLSHPTIASKEGVWRQYDHMVRINTVVLPGSDAAVVRIKGTPRAVALSCDCNPHYCFLDPYEGAKQAVAEAARNVACSGAMPRAITNCLNFGNPEKPEVMWEFAQAVKGMGEACRVLETPVTGGNVSFYNETNGKGVLPTPTIGMVGIIENLQWVITQGFKNEGDLVAVLGDTKGHLEGSLYEWALKGVLRGDPPKVDLQAEKRLYHLLVELARDRLISSAHDTSEGGLGVCLAECCLSSKGLLGAEILVEDWEIETIPLLFGEDQGRVVISYLPANHDDIAELCHKHGVTLTPIGEVAGKDLSIQTRDGKVKMEVRELRSTWRNSLFNLMGWEIPLE